jgi:hypothetical protein
MSHGMLLRLVSTGLCAACVVLLATFQPIRLESPSSPLPSPAPGRQPTPPLSVVDASAQVAPSELAALAHLATGEWVRAINDRPLDGELEPAELLAQRVPRAGEYLDLTVSNGTAERRVLVLIH